MRRTKSNVEMGIPMWKCIPLDKKKEEWKTRNSSLPGVCPTNKEMNVNVQCSVCAGHNWTATSNFIIVLCVYVFALAEGRCLHFW